MKLHVYNADGQAVGETTLKGVATLEGDKGVQALKEVVVAQAANARLGTHSTKKRGEVRGGGKKPWRQKGTGRARHGSIRSPIWTGGGVAFGPKPRDYSKKINRKVKDLALQRALQERVQDGSIAVVQKLELATGKTRDLSALIGKLAPDGTVLVVDTAVAATVERAARNLARVTLQRASDLNPTDLCKYDRYIVTQAALDAVTARLGGNNA
jgi:large subunit ribosomal protein L4